MKIIGVDNYARETVADFLVCENVRNERLGQIIVDELNRISGDGGAVFYKLVPADHKLWRGMEELV